MNSAQKVVVIVGVGFAALVLAQAVFRTGTPAMFDWEWSKTEQAKDKAEEGRDGVRMLGDAFGLDWLAINELLSGDAEMYNQAVRNGGTDDLPGIVTNLGGLEGRPYTWIDGQPYYLSGR